MAVDIHVAKGSWSYISVSSEPKVSDPREFKTILTFSLRNLWGDLEPYSCQVKVGKQAGDEVGNDSLLVIQCLSEDVPAVRSALTLVTPPPYLEATIYRFDVIDIQQDDADRFG